MNKLLEPFRWLSKMISKVVTTIVLTFVYFLGIGPIFMLGKILRKDFIGEKKRDCHTLWFPCHEKEPTLESFLKPY